MSNKNFALLLSLATAAGMCLPSFAADSASTKHGGVNTTENASSGSAENAGLNTAVAGSLMVTRVGGAGVGVVCGTPVAIVRETYKSYTTWTPSWADKIGMGGKDCGPCCALVSLASVPASIVYGTVMGTFHGAKNGMTKGFNAPFHPDSFSLGKNWEE